MTNNFKLKRNLLFLFASFFTFYIVHSTFYISPVFAQESTPTPTISEDIRAKLRVLQDEIASKATQLKQEMIQKLQNKALLGIIASKSETGFRLNYSKGNKEIIIKDYTEYLGKGLPPRSGKVTFKSLEVDDFVVVLGDIDDQENMIAKKIIKTPAPQVDQRQVVLGQIISIDKKGVTLQNKDNSPLTFTSDNKTKIKIAGKDGLLKDLQSGQKAVAVLIRSKDSTFKARSVYILAN